MRDVIIIGSGPAGITAGIYAARKNLNALILTKDFIGQVGNAGKIENWPGEKEITGPELINKFESHLKEYDVEIKEELVKEIVPFYIAFIIVILLIAFFEPITTFMPKFLGFM